MNAFNPCIVIPIYNHKDTILEVINSLDYLELPFLIIDDASNEATKNILTQLENEKESVQIITRSENGGKGAAVKTGLASAFERKYSHALQMDADGQHRAADAKKFIETAKQNPEALILGQPYFDNEAPSSRVYGRKITHFFVWIETVSFKIKDTLCGFRVYPLEAIHELTKNTNLRDRMDFDPEVAVRLYWQEVPIINIKTFVQYEEGGLSHFNFIRDNGLMISLHISLLLESLKHSPRLIWNAIKRNF